MSSTAHIISAILLLILITVMFGGFSLLWLLRDRLQGDQVLEPPRRTRLRWRPGDLDLGSCRHC